MAMHVFSFVTRQNIERAANIIRRVIGVPDYDRYVSHMHAHHPRCTLLSREEFTRQRMVDRYKSSRFAVC